MPSPPRLRRSPGRQALHERSQSQTNERGSPTLRIVDAFSKTDDEGNPYPTKPSQVLLPSAHHALVPTYEWDTSSRHRADNSTFVFPQELEPTKENVPNRRTEWHSPSSAADHADLPLADAPQVQKKSQEKRRAKPTSVDHASSTGTRQTATDGGSHETGASVEPQDETAILGPPTERQPSNKDSDNSLSSTNTTGTVHVKRNQDGRKQFAYSAFPYIVRPSSSRSSVTNPVSSNSTPASLRHQNLDQTADPSMRPDSAGTSGHAREFSYVPFAGSALSKERNPQVQYPVIRPPSASGSWAQSSTTVPPVPERSAQRAHRWNPHLSTVPSEPTNSILREHHNDDDLDQESSETHAWPTEAHSYRELRQSHAEQVPADSEDAVPTTIEPPPPSSFPPPSSSYPQRSTDHIHSSNTRGFSEPTIRVVEGSGNVNAKLYSGVSALQNSNGPAMEQVIGHRRRGLEATTRPSSRASFFRDSMPAWAKAYYARASSSFSSYDDRRSSVATDDISLNGGRGKGKKKQQQQPLPKPSRRRSGLAMHPIHPEDPYSHEASDPIATLTRSVSPHLWQDHSSSSRRRSLFQMPSIDEAAEGNSLTKRNAQIICFALGFVCPVSWFVAALLPLPPKPAILSIKGKGEKQGVRSSSAMMAADIEASLGATRAVARYENARWWRMMNRIMCCAGTIILILIITLVAVSAS